jgi:hypothetical protein
MKTLLARWPRTIAALRLVALGSLALGLGILLGTLAVALDVPQPFLVAAGGAATLLLALITMLQPQLVATDAAEANAERRQRRAQRSSPPTVTLRRGTAGKTVSRTPRAVETLAAAGAAPTDIAWQTGLPVDAVSMVLTIARGRQLQPPVTP